MFSVMQIPLLKDNYSYIISDIISKTTTCIDPGNAEEILRYLKKNNLKLDYILNTHHHSDHVGGNLELKKIFNCKIVGSFTDLNRIPGIELGLKDQELFDLGGSKLRVIETPGHTVGHICFYSYESKSLFSGDTLFSLGCGRLFEGSCKQMMESLLKLRSLPGETKVYCGHEYTQSNSKFVFHLDKNNENLKRKIEQIKDKRNRLESTVPSTISEEIELNPFMKFDDEGYLDVIGFKNVSNEENFRKIRKMKDDF